MGDVVVKLDSNFGDEAHQYLFLILSKSFGLALSCCVYCGATPAQINDL
jgi:hypothetical protein